VGRSKRFDESLIVLKHIYGWRLPHYQRQNVTPKRTALDRLDERTREVIQELNQGDIRLYDQTMETFEKRLAAVPQFGAELTRLRRVNAITRFPGVRRIARWMY